MGIQTTRNITRIEAIARIKSVYKCVVEHDYRELVLISSENHTEQTFVDAGLDFDVKYIEKWSDRMLEDKMNQPYFRRSEFDNYFIV